MLFSLTIRLGLWAGMNFCTDTLADLKKQQKKYLHLNISFASAPSCNLKA